MHVSTHSTNLNFTVPVTSTTQRQIQPVLECRESVAQHSGQQHIVATTKDSIASADCDTEDEVCWFFFQLNFTKIHFRFFYFFPDSENCN